MRFDRSNEHSSPFACRLPLVAFLAQRLSVARYVLATEREREDVVEFGRGLGTLRARVTDDLSLALTLQLAASRASRHHATPTFEACSSAASPPTAASVSASAFSHSA